MKSQVYPFWLGPGINSGAKGRQITWRTSRAARFSLRSDVSVFQKIKLITDSASDLPEEFCAKYNVEIVPLTIIFGEKEYKEEITLSPEEFWKKLMTYPELPSTNQVNPHEFEEAFRPHLDDGYTILYIGLSHKLSGTLQSATIAKEALGSPNIHIFDSYSASIGQGLLVIRAAEMLKQGRSLEDILCELEVHRQNAFGRFTLDSLTHLVRGGRLSKTQAFFGSVLNIKPVLTITKEGTIQVEEKVRSTRKALQTIVARAKEQRSDFSNSQVAVVHSYGAESINELLDLVESKLQPKEIIQGLIGPTIGTHAGPGGVALFF